jgi:RNA recognition motif-containing protein
MKLHVGNLPHVVTDEVLRETFAPYGTVRSATVVMDQTTERSRGFGFVEMSLMAEAQAAIQGLNGKELQGRTLTVNEARPRENRNDRSGGRGRSDDRDRQGTRRSW